MAVGNYLAGQVISLPSREQGHDWEQHGKEQGVARARDAEHVQQGARHGTHRRTGINDIQREPCDLVVWLGLSTTRAASSVGSGVHFRYRSSCTAGRQCTATARTSRRGSACSVVEAAALVRANVQRAAPGTSLLQHRDHAKVCSSDITCLSDGRERTYICRPSDCRLPACHLKPSGTDAARNEQLI
jgi:hypothetical protein